MFKVIMLVRKKETLSTDEFIRYWRAHSEKVMKWQSVLRIKAYAKTFPLPSDTRRKTGLFDFDAMGELWYDSEAEFMQARDSDEGRKVLQALKADEEKFVDLAHSVMWWGEEERIIWA